MAKDAGVHILTLHPHTSGKLQALDGGDPFKVYYNATIDSWLMGHAGTPIKSLKKIWRWSYDVELYFKENGTSLQENLK